MQSYMQIYLDNQVMDNILKASTNQTYFVKVRVLG